MNQVSDAQKQEFLELLKTLPTQGEFYTEETVKKAGPYLAVLFALTEKDIEKYDIYPFIESGRWITITRLLETPAAQDYLRSRGIKAAEFVTSFRVGYADGTLTQKLPVEGRRALRRVGVLTGSGRECCGAAWSFFSCCWWSKQWPCGGTLRAQH